MATIRPFAALRPQPQLANKICELPYDVMSSGEARQMAAGNPLSFLHVSKPEIDLPSGTDLYSPEVYAKGSENFQKLISQGALKQDSRKCFYLYRQIMGSHSQTGLVATASCEEYLKGAIKKHELTRPDKEDDRVRHIEALHSQTGPVFLTYKAIAAIDEFVAKKISSEPEIDFTAKDGVRHTSWSIGDEEGIRFLETHFAKIPSLYIADGHHRCAAAARVYLQQKANTQPTLGQPLRADGKEAGGESAYAFFLAVTFPHNQMQVLPYNRVLKDLNGLAPAQLLEELGNVFEIKIEENATPTCKHELGLFVSGQWHSLKFQSRFTNTADLIEKLDVTLLQKHVLAPIFGVNDPRTSKRVDFVGGIRGTDELEKLVNNGEYACAFSLFPTSIEDLMAIADKNGIMPPKSTWFEPKLRDAMFCHLI